MLFTSDQVVFLKWFPNANMFLYDLAMVEGGNEKSHIFASFSAQITEASNVTIPIVTTLEG
jgi:hypothetical protein